jgi:hypothetical protein
MVPLGVLEITIENEVLSGNNHAGTSLLVVISGTT